MMLGLTIKKTTFYALLLLPAFFLYSYLLISPYSEGDQAHYRGFYGALENADAESVMLLARKSVGSVEPVSAYILWVGARLGIDKDIYVSLLNSLLLVGFLLLGRMYGVGFIPLLLIFTNFYVVVLLTGAERLKVAYIFLVWADFLSGSRGRVLVGVSPMAHLQSFIMFPSLFLANHSESIRSLLASSKLKVRFVVSFVVVIVFLVLLLGYFQEGVVRKASNYISDDSHWSEIWKLFLLSVIAFWVTKNRWRIVLVVLPLYPAVFLLSGSRVNMIAVTLVIYFLMRERLLSHPLVMLLLIYCSLKSTAFVCNIVNHGDGFI